MRNVIRDMPVGRIMERYGLLTMFLAAYFMGVFFGSMLSVSLSGEDGIRLAGLIHSLSLTETAVWPAFISSLQNTVFFLLAVYFCGIMLLGFPLVFLIIFYKGYTVGFAIGFICSVYGFRGLLISFLCVLPQAVITTAALMLAGKKAFDFSFSMFGAYSSKSQKHAQVGHLSQYSLGFLLYLCISLVSLIFDVLVAPFFAKLML